MVTLRSAALEYAGDVDLGAPLRGAQKALPTGLHGDLGSNRAHDQKCDLQVLSEGQDQVRLDAWIASGDLVHPSQVTGHPHGLRSPGLLSGTGAARKPQSWPGPGRGAAACLWAAGVPGGGPWGLGTGAACGVPLQWPLW